MDHYIGSLSMSEGTVIAGLVILMVFLLSNLLDFLADKCESKAANACNPVTRFLFNVVKVATTIISIPITLCVVLLSVMFAGCLMTGSFILFLVLLPIAVVRDVAVALLTTLWAGRNPNDVLKA